MARSAVVALLLCAILTAHAANASDDLDTTDISKTDSISPEPSNSESISESIKDTSVLDAPKAIALQDEIKETHEQINPETRLNLNNETPTEAAEATNLNQNLLDEKSGNTVSRRVLDDANNSVVLNPSTEETETNKQSEISQTKNGDSININPVSVHLENDVIKPTNDITNSKKTPFVRSAGESGDLEDISKRSSAIAQASAVAQVNDANAYPKAVNQIPYDNVTPVIMIQPNRDDINTKRVPQNELIPAQELIVENIIVTCSYEGDMFLVRSARAGCLVCACFGARAPQAVCAACSACGQPAPAPTPPRRAPLCDRHPPRQIFPDPLDPCRQCICSPNAYGVLTPTCMPNPDCKTQPETPYPQIVTPPSWIPSQPTELPPLFPYPYVQPHDTPKDPRFYPTPLPDPQPSDMYPLAPLFPPIITPPPPITSPPSPYPPYVPDQHVDPLYPTPSPSPYTPLGPVVPLPRGDDLPLPWPPKSPLPGPRPHKSCAPFPEGVPFQHPWSECLACVCEHVAAPPHSDIEVTCYTKPSCCIEPGTTVGPPREPKNQLQILDRICEARSVGTAFLDPRDQCRACVCRVFGTTIAPACTPAPNANPQKCKKTPEKQNNQINIKFIEPRCRYIAPHQPYVVGCSRCVCEVVFYYVIAQCTRIPNCVDPQSQGVSSRPPSQAIAEAQAIAGTPLNQIPMYQPKNFMNPDFYQNYPPSSLQNYPQYPISSIQSEAIAQADGGAGDSSQAAAYAQADSNAANSQADASSGNSGAFAQADSSLGNAYPYSPAGAQAQSSAIANGDSAFAQADATSSSQQGSVSAVAQAGAPSSGNPYPFNPSSIGQTAPPPIQDGSLYGTLYPSSQINSLPQSSGPGSPYNNAYSYSPSGPPTQTSPLYGNQYPSNVPTTPFPQSNVSPYGNNLYPPYPQITSPMQLGISPSAASPSYSNSYPYPSGTNPSSFVNSYPNYPSGSSAQASASAQADFSPRNTYPYNTNQASAVSQADAGNSFPSNSGNPYSNAFPNAIRPVVEDINPTSQINKDPYQQLYNSANPYLRTSDPSSNVNYNSQNNPNMLMSPTEAPSAAPGYNVYAAPSVAGDGSLYSQTDSPFSPTEGNYYSPTSDPYAYNYARPTAAPWTSSSISPEYGDSVNPASDATAQGQTALGDPYSRAKPYSAGGRGQCQFDGDMYREHCQACFCRADAAGSLLATCYGTPCSKRPFRACNVCHHDLMKSFRNVGIQWICGSYQRARRSFKSECMLRYRNCQDGTSAARAANNDSSPAPPPPPPTALAASAATHISTLPEPVPLKLLLQARRQARKHHRSTSSSSGEREKKSKEKDGSAEGKESLGLTVSSKSSSRSGSKESKKNKYMPKSSAERKGWRKWHRKCAPCPEQRVPWRHPSVQWICGGYQRARRSFKSICMMRFRNCQDGTMFVLIHRHRCEAHEDKERGFGEHFFYDYKVALSIDSTDTSASETQSKSDSSDSS